MQSRDTDVLVAGGGPVGAALVAMLASQGVDARLVAQPVPRAAMPTPAPLRPIALSTPTRAALGRLGMGRTVPFTPIRSIHVSQTGGFGRTRMDAAEHGLDALGHVCDLATLSRALAADASPWRADGTVLGWSVTDAGTHVEVAGTDGVVEAWSTRLLVVADGGASGEAVVVRDYDQTAIAAMVSSETAHANVAWERFTSEGPLALLPFEDRYALVWSMRTTRADRLMKVDDAAFVRELGDAFGRRLGRFVTVEGRIAYPLALRRTAEPATAGVVRIGNAAQTLHPVAGQGLNLGLRDAAVLAARIARTPRDAIGTLDFARDYARERMADRLGTIGATDFLARIFAVDFAPLRLARGAGLALLDALPPARRAVARRMMLGLR